jgi:translocation and assembly module TamA
MHDNAMVNSSIAVALRRNLPISLLMLAFCFLAAPAYGNQLEIVVQGLEEPMLKNVVARTQTFQVFGNTRLSRKRRETMQSNAVNSAFSALRPYGYYHPVISSDMKPAGNGNWQITLKIDKGPPVIITKSRVEISGPGGTDEGLSNWKGNWPLTTGNILNQVTWEAQKTEALDLAEVHGYLGARFSEQAIRLDLENNTAELSLVLETGEQFLIGSVVYEQDVVRNDVLDSLKRFSEGQAYDQWLIEQFRLDLWRTGYFNNIEVLEERKPDETPPRVNLVASLDPRKRNTYQGSLGYGTDTGIRAQAVWNRHLLSSRGDSLMVGLGWKDRNKESTLRAAYRQPRKVQGQQYWTADMGYSTEIQTFDVSSDNDPDNLVTVARGRVDDFNFKPGWLIVRGRERGYQQLFEQWYIDYLKEKTAFSLADGLPAEYSALLARGEDPGAVNTPSQSLSVGVSWELPVIRGNGFETVGHRHHAWIFTSNTAWGSDSDFSQAYISSRWNKIFKKRWKILLRGEVGYSNARVYERTVVTPDDSISISVTELPYAYRFKAGGSQSVRGYGFETLSNNNIGSNNIVTASAELEYHFKPKWSAAVFFDIGNAFNEWNAVDLKMGAGVGIRWYSIAGPIRLDFAQALDTPGKPWSIHFTIGSPLL